MRGPLLLDAAGSPPLRWPIRKIQSDFDRAPPAVKYRFVIDMSSLQQQLRNHFHRHKVIN